jgi:aspartate kinase
MKFGGTSVANLSKIRNIAKIVKENSQKNKIVVVLSAMSGVTNQLQSYVEEVTSQPSRETDLVITSGEQVTVGLLSIILNREGIKSLPLLGWQVPIVTDENHGKGRILNINNETIHHHFKSNDVIVLAGFQGISVNGDSGDEIWRYVCC